MTADVGVGSKDEMARRRALIVLGMHRSGTSAMTRTLSLLGASLPANLMPANSSNSQGFWESLGVADLNDEILQALDSEWDDVFAFRPRQYLSNFDRFYLGRASELLEQQFNGSEVIVLKDPRISVLSTFWNRALSEAGYSTNYVIMVRNPLEVAESLRARDGFPREKSLLLWSSYMVAADRDTRDQRRIFVSYDQLMSDWRGVRRRIEAKFGFPFPRDTAAAANEIDRHLDQNLRHHGIAAEDLFDRTDVAEEVKTLYRIFSAACDGVDVDEAAVDTVALDLAKMDALLGPLLADFRGRVRSLTNEVGSLAAQAAEAAMRSEALNQELAGERERIAVVESERDQAVAQAQASGADYETRLAELTERIAAAEGDRDRVFGEAQASGAEYERQLAELAERIAAAEAERGRITAEAEERMQGLAAERDSVLQLLDRAEMNRSAANAELERSEAEVTRARELLAQQETQFRAALGDARAEKAEAEAKLSEGIRNLAVLNEKSERMETLTKDLRDALARKQAEIDVAAEELQSERTGAAVRLNERFRELATLTSLLADKEEHERQVREQLDWLRDAASILAETSSTAKGRLLALLPGIFLARRQRRLLKRKGLFDSDAYVAANSDVAADGVDPLRHYLKHGLSERRRLS